VNLDDSVMASCSIIKGDLPVKIWWKFSEEINDQMSYNLTSNDGIVITKPSQKISILAIDAVKARHRGNYTCFAQNKGGVAQFSSYLSVNGSKILKNFEFFTERFCNLFPLKKHFMILNFFSVLPLIMPFTFGDEELNLDESVSVICSITKGDLPLKIWWTFKGDFEEFPYNLTTNDGVMITRSGQKVSMIQIDAVKARHRGNYTCFAHNKAGISQQSSYLAINGHLCFKLYKKIQNFANLFLQKNFVDFKLFRR
jgi:hypothetical protein